MFRPSPVAFGQVPCQRALDEKVSGQEALDEKVSWQEALDEQVAWHEALDGKAFWRPSAHTDFCPTNPAEPSCCGNDVKGLLK